MAVTYGFYDSLNHDRLYNAQQMSAIFDGVINDGVFASVGNQLHTVAGSGMQVIVKSGRAWFNSTWTLNDAEYPLTVSAADVLLTRIDAVVLEVNSEQATRANSIKVVKGTPASTPAKPTLTNTSTVHQHALAYVTVAKNTTAITNSMIEIVVGKTETPYVTAILQTTDITDLFKNWEDQFKVWFETVKGTLDGDVALNLQNQIDHCVKKADKATAADIEAGTADKWVDSETMLKSRYNVGDIYLSATDLRENEEHTFVRNEGYSSLSISDFPEYFSKVNFKYGVSFNVKTISGTALDSNPFKNIELYFNYIVAFSWVTVNGNTYYGAILRVSSSDYSIQKYNMQIVYDKNRIYACKYYTSSNTSDLNREYVVTLDNKLFFICTDSSRYSYLYHFYWSPDSPNSFSTTTTLSIGNAVSALTNRYPTVVFVHNNNIYIYTSYDSYLYMIQITPNNTSTMSQNNINTTISGIVYDNQHVCIFIKNETNVYTVTIGDVSLMTYENHPEHLDTLCSIMNTNSYYLAYTNYSGTRYVFSQQHEVRTISIIEIIYKDGKVSVTKAYVDSENNSSDINMFPLIVSDTCFLFPTFTKYAYNMDGNLLYLSAFMCSTTVFSYMIYDEDALPNDPISFPQIAIWSQNTNDITLDLFTQDRTTFIPYPDIRSESQLTPIMYWCLK